MRVEGVMRSLMFSRDTDTGVTQVQALAHQRLV
ncbi:MAG: hypothetical protein K0S58_3083, partial [Nitrospira sp.]|nr:hypothetical protein [Nitrospira sp.]